MKIYPNPTKSLAYLAIPAEMKNGGKIEVRNSAGEIIDQIQYMAGTADVIPLDLSNQPKGFYDITVADSDYEVSRQLLNI